MYDDKDETDNMLEKDDFYLQNVKEKHLISSNKLN